MYTILASTWFTASLDTEIVGIVAVLTSAEGNWKAFLGACHEISQEENEQYIAMHGSALTARQAGAFFPQLNEECYQVY